MGFVDPSTPLDYFNNSLRMGDEVQRYEKISGKRFERRLIDSGLKGFSACRLSVVIVFHFIGTVSF